MNRPSKVFTTSGGYDVEMYTYITGGEFEKIQSCFLDGATLELDSNLGETAKPRVGGINVKEMESNASSTLIEILVTQLNGTSDDIIKRVKDLPKDDYLEILKELNEATGKKTQAVS